MNNPTLIDMPEPPSNPDTPTETPGTPNSTTTSLSALSTTAFKDGHRGASFPSHRQTPSTNTLEAERADRISRLAGLERVTTARAPNPSHPAAAGQIPGYFDQNGNPVYTTKMLSTVGSASATGSGARTMNTSTGTGTEWASGSASQRGGDDDMMDQDGDVMSMDANYRDMDERDRYSTSAMDDEGDADEGMSDDTSLVGFGEGAGSTMSGPTYSRKEALSRSMLTREGSGTGSSFGPYSASGSGAPGAGTGGGGTSAPGSSAGVGLGTEAAERIVRERLDEGEGKKPVLGSPDEAGLGKFYFENKK